MMTLVCLLKNHRRLSCFFLWVSSIFDSTQNFRPNSSSVCGTVSWCSLNLSNLVVQSSSFSPYFTTVSPPVSVPVPYGIYSGYLNFSLLYGTFQNSRYEVYQVTHIRRTSYLNFPSWRVSPADPLRMLYDRLSTATIPPLFTLSLSRLWVLHKSFILIL